MSTRSDFELENLSLETSQQRLLAEPHDQVENATPGDDDGHHAVGPASHSPSLFSYDSLEEIPSQRASQPEVSTNPVFQHQPIKSGYWPHTIWILEIWSCATAAACLAAIVGILRGYQGLPLPRWPMHITINALVSVFTAIFKMALTMPIAEGISQFKWLWFSRPRELADIERFDSASKGAWGSFLLLISRVPRLDSIWLANLGAIVMIAAVAVDPFSQQIIQSQPCLQNAIHGPPARIPRTQNIDPFMTAPAHAGRSHLPGSMQAAIYMGLLSPPPNSSATISASCQTGNCTFPSDEGATFSTLAMCHACVDISNTITYDNSSSVYGSRPSSLPSGLKIDGLDTMFASSSGSELFPYSSILSFEALMSRGTYPENVTSDLAIACGMYSCVKTFVANIIENRYSELEVLSAENLLWSYYAGFTLATNRTLQNGTWQSCAPTAQNTSMNWLRINTTSMTLISDVRDGIEKAVHFDIDLQKVSATPGASLWYPEDCVWWLGNMASTAMRDYLADFFNNKTLVTPYWSRQPSSVRGDLWLANLYRNGTASLATAATYMDGLAWSLTGVMRTDSEDGDALRAVTGQVQRLESCLVVRWAWLSLPASLFGLEMGFLVAIALLSRSKRHWRGDWKSSSLALLFHGLDGHSTGGTEQGKKARSGNVSDKEGMFKMAEGMKVQLRKAEDRWRFCPT